MKILTIGLSPYLLISRGILHRDILKHLFLSRHEVASIVSGHDITIFAPEEDEKTGQCQSFYEFSDNNQKHKIPIFPLETTQDPTIQVYEIINELKPDIVLTVGDLSEFAFMSAIKQFCQPIRWIAVLTQYNLPIHENLKDCFKYISCVICTSKTAHKEVCQFYDNVTVCYVGHSPSFKMKNKNEIRKIKGISDCYRIMTCAKNLTSDNLATVIQVCSSLRKEIPDLRLYLHTNIYDRGEYDLDILKTRFGGDFIDFPSQYVSLFDGPSDDELCDEINASDLLLSAPMSSATAMGLFDGMSCGVPCVSSGCGVNKEVLGLFSDQLAAEGISFMARGENNAFLCDPKSLKEIILEQHKNYKMQKGLKEKLSELYKKHKREDFLEFVMKHINEKVTNSESLFVVE